MWLIQIWAIPATGEATEILSWRHSTIRVLRLIPTPFKTGSNNIDLFASSRPLIAVCDSVANFSTLVFRSLKAGIVDPVMLQTSFVFTIKKNIFIVGETNTVQSVSPERFSQSTFCSCCVHGENSYF